MLTINHCEIYVKQGASLCGTAFPMSFRVGHFNILGLQLSARFDHRRVALWNQNAAASTLHFSWEWSFACFAYLLDELGNQHQWYSDANNLTTTQSSSNLQGKNMAGTMWSFWPSCGESIIPPRTRPAGIHLCHATFVQNA